MTPYAKRLLGIPSDQMYIPRRLIYPKHYLKLIKKIFFRRWKRNLYNWLII